MFTTSLDSSAMRNAILELDCENVFDEILRNILAMSHSSHYVCYTGGWIFTSYKPCHIRPNLSLPESRPQLSDMEDSHQYLVSQNFGS